MGGVLAQLKEAGYACVETMFGRPPQRRAALDRLHLRCYAVHVALSAMPPEAELIDFTQGMGAETVCVSGLLRWEERAADDYRRAGEALNVWGQRLQNNGLALHYHNHDFEFAVVEGGATGMDLLLSRLDPGLVSLCFDAGWAFRAGHDLVRFAAQHASRIRTAHLRDFRGANSVPLGAGDIDLPGIVSALAALPHLQAMLVEQDPATETPVEDMAVSRRFLSAQCGL